MNDFFLSVYDVIANYPYIVSIVLGLLLFIVVYISFIQKFKEFETRRATLEEEKIQLAGNILVANAEIKALKDKLLLVSTDPTNIFKFIDGTIENEVLSTFEFQMKPRIMSDDNMKIINDELFLGYVSSTTYQVLSNLSEGMKDTLLHYVDGDNGINLYVTKRVYFNLYKVVTNLNKLSLRGVKLPAFLDKGNEEEKEDKVKDKVKDKDKNPNAK